MSEYNLLKTYPKAKRDIIINNCFHRLNKSIT